MSLHSFQWLDALVIGLVLASAFLSARKGLIAEMGLLVGGAVAVLVAAEAGPAVAETLSRWIPAPFDLIAGFLVVFVVVLGLSRLLMNALAALLQSLGISALDQALGLVFGLLRGLLILVALVYAVSLTRLAQHPQYQSAATRPMLEALARETLSRLPDDLGQMLPDSPLLLKR